MSCRRCMTLVWLILSANSQLPSQEGTTNQPTNVPNPIWDSTPNPTSEPTAEPTQAITSISTSRPTLEPTVNRMADDNSSLGPNKGATAELPEQASSPSSPMLSSSNIDILIVCATTVVLTAIFCLFGIWLAHRGCNTGNCFMFGDCLVSGNDMSIKKTDQHKDVRPDNDDTGAANQNSPDAVVPAANRYTTGRYSIVTALLPSLPSPAKGHVPIEVIEQVVQAQDTETVRRYSSSAEQDSEDEDACGAELVVQHTQRTMSSAEVPQDTITVSSFGDTFGDTVGSLLSKLQKKTPHPSTLLSLNVNDDDHGEDNENGDDLLHLQHEQPTRSGTTTGDCEIDDYKHSESRTSSADTADQLDQHVQYSGNTPSSGDTTALCIDDLIAPIDMPRAVSRATFTTMSCDRHIAPSKATDSGVLYDMDANEYRDEDDEGSSTLPSIRI